MKRIEIDGKFYRKRRGKLVQIPDAWVGVTTCGQRRRRRKRAKEKKENHCFAKGYTVNSSQSLERYKEKSLARGY